MTKFEEFLKRLIGTVFLIFRVIRNKSFLNRFPETGGHDRAVYVLGNGPSLKEVLSVDTDFLRGQELFVVNRFCLTPDFGRLKPRYYILLDPAFVVSTNTLPKYLELQRDILKAFSDIVDWPLTIFIPSFTDLQAQWEGLQRKNRNIELCYVSIVHGEAAPLLKQALYKRSMAMPEPTNVLVAAIFISLNMGYGVINILGGDHSWIRDLRVDDNNDLFALDKHFYGGGDLRCVNAGKQDAAWTVGALLSAWATSFKSYFELNAYAKFIGAKVYNLTEGSFIDAFPRRKIGSGDGGRG